MGNYFYFIFEFNEPLPIEKMITCRTSSLYSIGVHVCVWIHSPSLKAKQSNTNKLANISARVLAGKSFLRLVAIVARSSIPHCQIQQN